MEDCMNRKFLSAVLVMTAAAAFLAATGVPEAGSADDFSGELVTVTGTLVLEESGYPALKSGDELWGLMYPYYLAQDLEVEDGEEITVEGYTMPAAGRRFVTDNRYLMVTKAVIRGEEYEVPHGPMGGRGMMPAPRGAMPDSRWKTPWGGRR